MASKKDGTPRKPNTKHVATEIETLRKSIMRLKSKAAEFRMKATELDVISNKEELKYNALVNGTTLPGVMAAANGTAPAASTPAQGATA
jgi:hypothetical protein